MAHSGQWASLTALLSHPRLMLLRPGSKLSQFCRSGMLAPVSHGAVGLKQLFVELDCSTCALLQKLNYASLCRFRIFMGVGRSRETDGDGAVPVDACLVIDLPAAEHWLSG